MSNEPLVANYKGEDAQRREQERAVCVRVAGTISRASGGPAHETSEGAAAPFYQNDSTIRQVEIYILMKNHSFPTTST